MSVGLSGADLDVLIQQYQSDFQGASLQHLPTSEVTSIAAQPEAATLITSESDIGLYDIYRIEAKYIRDAGKLLLPLSTDGVTRIAKVSAPFGYKLVMFEVARANAFPKLPAVEEDDGTQLLTSELTALNDVVDGTTARRIYRTAGYYLYAVKTPLVLGDSDIKIPVPSLPNISSKSLPIESTDFQEGLAPVEDTGTAWS